jgi:hypothetical protein
MARATFTPLNFSFRRRARNSGMVSCTTRLPPV